MIAIDKNKIEKIVSNAKYDVPMSTLTTFRVGGPADCVVYPQSVQEIKEIIAYADSANVPYTILGNGSNVLVGDSGIDGIVIRIDENFSKIDVQGDVVTARAGALLSKVASAAYKASLGGFEFAAGIPGTVGGAMVMNAGAYGGEMKDIVKEVVVLNAQGNVETLTNAQMEFGYRHSIIADSGMVVLQAAFALERADAVSIKARMDELKEKRTSKQPLDKPSAGSTFKRPEGYFAGALIEEAGLKGYRVGGACVSTKHAGFVVNDNGASASDILKLIQDVQDKVYKQSGVMLTPEVKKIGKFN